MRPRNCSEVRTDSVREVPEQDVLHLVLRVECSQRADSFRFRLHALPGYPREQFESEICRPRFILEIEQPVVLRPPVPPAGHESHAVRRHEFREGLRFHVVIADVVVARVVEAAFEHVPNRLENECRLHHQVVFIGLHQRNIPLVEHRLRMQRGMGREQLFHAVGGAAKICGVAGVTVPGNEVQRRLGTCAEFQESRQNGRSPVGQSRPPDARGRIAFAHRGRRPLVIDRVVIRTKSIGAASIFADVRFVRNLPILNAVAAVFVVLHQGRDQPLPFPPVVWLDDVLIDFRVKQPRLEIDVHQRLRSGLQDQVYRAVQLREVIPSVRRQEVEILLDEKADQPGPQGANLRGAFLPHGLFRESSLPQRHARHVERAGEIRRRDGDGRRSLLGASKGGGQRQADSDYRDFSHPIPKSSSVSRPIIASMAASGMRGRLVFSAIWFTARSAFMVCCGVVNG